MLEDFIKCFVIRLPYLIIPTKYGLFVTPPSSPKAQMLGRYEPEVSRTLEKFLKQGDVFIDIGAHAGYFTLKCARIVGRSGLIVSFEPNPMAYRALYLNVLINRLVNVWILKMALSNRDGIGFLKVPKIHGINYTSEGKLSLNSGMYKVYVTKLDTFLAKAKIKPDVIKIDVEGEELNVLKGGIRTLKTGVRLLVVELHSGSNIKIIQDLLKSLDYKMIVKGRWLFCFGQ